MVKSNILAEIGNLLILAQIERMKKAAVALLDADDNEFNEPFSQLCELDAELLGVPQVKQTEVTR